MLKRRKTQSSGGYQEDMHHTVAINYTLIISHPTRDCWTSLMMVVLQQVCSTGYLWGAGDAQRMRRLVWTHWPIGRSRCVVLRPFLARWFPHYTSSNPSKGQLTGETRPDCTLARPP
jgi:hypothetical protein